MSRSEETLQVLRDGCRGLLALDERLVIVNRPGSIPPVLTTTGLRRAFHEACAAAPGLSRWIAAISLFEESLRQRTSCGAMLPALIERHGMMPGVRIDAGAIRFDENDSVTDGLDGLEVRLAASVARGARFGAWHMALRPDEAIAGCRAAVAEDCNRLTAFVRACGQADCLPLLTFSRRGDALETRLLRSYREFFRQVTSALHLGGSLPSSVAVRVRGTSDADNRRILQDLRDACSSPVGILFLTLDDDSEFEGEFTTNGAAHAYPSPLRFALGERTQMRLLGMWSDLPGHRRDLELRLVRDARASSAALSRAVAGI